MIHVCFGLHDRTRRYAKFTGTAMLSLFDNTKSAVTVHILHDNTLTSDSRDKFTYLAVQYNQRVKFYNVEELCAGKIYEMIRLVPDIKIARVSIGAFYRLLIPQLLPSDISKCIYLDSDMLVNLDIEELWQTELDDKPLAAVRELDANAYNYKNFDAAQKYLLNEGFVKYEDYFNSGVLVMNLKYLRNAEEFIMSGVKWRGEHNQCNCFDQDIWNYLFAKNYLKLPAKFDRFLCNERSQGITQIRNAIYHCSNPTLGLDMSDSLNRLWMKYFIKTPWFDENSIGRIYESFKLTYLQLRNEMKTSMRNLSTLLAYRERAFIVAKEDLEVVKEIFYVRDDEEIIIVDYAAPLQKLFDSMKISFGEKIFFIMIPNFPYNTFEQLGFVYGEDVINGLELLPTTEEKIPSTYPLIQII